MKFTNYFKYIMPLMRNSFLPSLLLCSALGCFFIFAPFSDKVLNLLHLGFFLIIFTEVFILIYYNQNRPLFFILLLALSYLFINYFKYQHGIIYYTSSDYLNLTFFSAVGFLYFYFQPNRPFASTESLKFLLVILIGFSVSEFLSKYEISLNYNFIICNGCGLQSIGFGLFIISLLVMLVHSSIKDDILSTALFFATISIFLGFYFSAKPSSFTIFFINSALTACLGLIHSLYYSQHKDAISGLDNANGFIIASAKFPLKYGLGIISIDDYSHLSQVFKKSGINEIVLMIIKKIRQTEPEALLYRYSPDEFIIIFPQAEKGTSFTRLDNIRRQIAAAEFMLSKRRKPLKITVSCSIAEKKRSDANVFEVFLRARKILQKTYKFTQNITSKA